MQSSPPNAPVLSGCLEHQLEKPGYSIVSVLSQNQVPSFGASVSEVKNVASAWNETVSVFNQINRIELKQAIFLET